MTITIRQIDLEDKWCQQSHLEILAERLPLSQIEDTLTAFHAWEQREKKLNMRAVVLLTIAMGLYPRQSLKRLVSTVSSPFRTLSECLEPVCTPGAFCQRRAQLPVGVFHSLFRSIARPLANPDTPGAFWRGRRVMAIDSTLEDVPDTQANARFFGRVTDGKQRSPFPQVRCTALLECGTHAIIDASLTPCRVGELTAARRLIRSVQADMLVCMDRGFRGLQVLQGIKRKGAEILCLVPASILHTYEERLADGSWIAILGKGRNCQDEPLKVRVLEYTLVEEGFPGTGQTYRLMTTLLDPETAPAVELIALYRERWEIETTFGEIDQQQQIEQQPLRSQTPLGVLQELYAILLGHFLVRDLMYQAATLPGEPAIAPTQLSYQGAMTVISTALSDGLWLAPDAASALKQRVLRDLRQERLPQRTNTVRMYPRVVKRAHNKFPQKRSYHHALARIDLTWSALFSLSK